MNSQSEVFTITEEMAEFPGGAQEMTRFIQKNLKYPVAAQKSSVGGKVFLKFIVEIDGSISSVEVLKSSGAEPLDKAAVEVVQAMPVWKPAKLSGREVRVYYNLPVNFKPDAPYIVFNTKNQNEYYNQAKKLLLDRAELNEVINLLQKDVGDVDAWYVLGVLDYTKGDKASSKHYFENVKQNTQPGAICYDMSNLFLTKYF